MLRSILLIFLILLVPPQPSSGNALHTIHYVCLEETLSNGSIVNTEFNIYPAINEYRYLEFRFERVESSAEQYDGVWIGTLLQNQAIANLVAEKGLKTIESRRILVNAKYEERATVRFQGFVKLPVDRLSIEREDGAVFSAKYEILFAPMALPSQFGSLFFRKKMKNFFSDTIDLFRN